MFFKNNTCFENYPPRYPPEKPAKKGEELSILEIWVGERTSKLKVDPLEKNKRKNETKNERKNETRKFKMKKVIKE